MKTHAMGVMMNATNGGHRNLNQTTEEECLPLPPDHDFGAHVANVPHDDYEERVPVVTHTHQAWGQGSAEPGELPFAYVPPAGNGHCHALSRL